MWEGEILPAAPAYCGNNEEASTYEVRSGPMIRAGSRSKVQVKVQVQVQSEAGGRWDAQVHTGSQVPKDGLGAGRPGRFSRAVGRRSSPRSEE